MFRVYRDWFMRRIVVPFGAKAFGILAFLWILKERVSVRHVVANAPSLANPLHDALFFQRAFFATELVVQVTLVASALFVAMLVRDVLRGYSWYEQAVVGRRFPL